MTKYKKGDVVVVYRYYKKMNATFPPQMKEWIGRLCKITDNWEDDVFGDTYTLVAIGWHPREKGWYWNNSVLRKATEDDIIMEML